MELDSRQQTVIDNWYASLPLRWLTKQGGGAARWLCAIYYRATTPGVQATIAITIVYVTLHNHFQWLLVLGEFYKGR